VKSCAESTRIARISLTIVFLALIAPGGFASGLKPSDAAIKRKLLGYWDSPRHSYLMKANGIMYMLGGTTTNHWDVRNGTYYEDGEAYDIVSLNESKFVFRLRKDKRMIFNRERASYEKGEEFRLSDPENAIPPPDKQIAMSGDGQHGTQNPPGLASRGAMAGAASDVAIKHKLLGYWSSGRHIYLVKADGTKFMLTSDTVNRWDVRDGVYYDDGQACDIITLTQKEFVYRPRSGDRITWYLERVNNERGEEIRRMFPDPQDTASAPSPQPGLPAGAQHSLPTGIAKASGGMELAAADAARHVGQNAVVTGVITSVEQSRAHLHMGLGGTPEKPDMYVFVPSFGETDIFPDYFKYRGATITVSGRIQRRNGYLGIDVSDPSQIVAKTEGLEDHAYLGHMKHKKGDLDGAIAEFDRAIEQDKQDSSNFKERASIKAEKGDAEGAIADYNRCLELTPNDTDAMWALGRLKLMMGDFDGAVALYDRSIKVFPRWC